MSSSDATETRRELYLAFARQMMLSGRRWRARFNERMKSVSQTHARFAVLFWINDSGNAIGQRDLAERMGIEEPTLARLLDALEGQGMVKRSPSPFDRRAKLVSMTDAARPVLEEGNLQVALLIDEAFAEISKEEAEAGLHVLSKLDDQLGRLPAATKSKRSGAN
jgi:MarR family transcriptional regulator for hemolysin